MLFNYRLLARQLLRSLFPGANRNLRLGGRRIRFLAVFAVAFPLMWISAMLALLLDNLFCSGYRSVRPGFPVFIIGNFRTGSTFLFRLLADDARTFTALRTWELYFAPSVLQRKLWRGFWLVDAFLGAPILHRIRRREEQVFSNVNLHRVRLAEPEEDEALLYLTWHTLFTWFFFPAPELGAAYYRFDSVLEHPTRRRLMRFYGDLVRRHHFANPGASHYLAKNPSATGRIISLLEQFPDARFIYLYRDPEETVPSTMRWFEFACRYFSSPADPYPLRDEVLDLTRHWYLYPLELGALLPPDRMIVVHYPELIRDPAAEVQRIYACLGLAMHAEYASFLSAAAHRSRERKSEGGTNLEEVGLTREEVRRRFADVYAAYRAAGARNDTEASSPAPPRG